MPLVCVCQAPLQPQPPLPQPLPGFGSALQPSADNHPHVTNMRTQKGNKDRSVNRFAQPVPTAAFGCVLQAVISQQPPLGPTPLLTFVQGRHPSEEPRKKLQISSDQTRSLQRAPLQYLQALG